MAGIRVDLPFQRLKCGLISRQHPARSRHCGHCKTSLPSGRFSTHSSHLARCGTQMRIIPPSPPRIAPARRPPLWEMWMPRQSGFDPKAQPAPDYEFDQRVAW